MTNKSVPEQLQKLEKLVKRVIRKSLKDNTLDYTVQFSVSSLEPGKVQYAAMITSPAKGVDQITFVYDSYELLEAALKESENEFSRQKVEIAFHKNRINSYENRIDQTKDRIKQLEDPNYKPEDDDIEMEEV